MSDARKILIVEDEIIIALDLAMALKAEGWNVIGPAGTVAQALDLIGQHPDLQVAILDINLGRERSDAVATVLKDTGIPILAISGDNELPKAQAFAGAIMLRKPMDTDDVMAQIAMMDPN